MSEAPSRGRSAAVLIGLILISQAAGALGALTTEAGEGSWYAGLIKPAFNPPPWIFGPVWITLYTFMGIAAWRVWRSRAAGARTALIIFGVQLVLNAAWTPIFFGAHMLGLALGVIIAMLIAILVTIRAFWPIDRLAGGLLIPYVLWVAFATVLNASLLSLNG